jgi:hypothetical protein
MWGRPAWVIYRGRRSMGSVRAGCAWGIRRFWICGRRGRRNDTNFWDANRTSREGAIFDLPAGRTALSLGKPVILQYAIATEFSKAVRYVGAAKVPVDEERQRTTRLGGRLRNGWLRQFRQRLAHSLRPGAAWSRRQHSGSIGPRLRFPVTMDGQMKPGD